MPMHKCTMPMPARQDALRPVVKRPSRDYHSIFIALYDKSPPCRGEAPFSFLKSLTNQRTENSTFVYEYAMPSTKPRLGEYMSFRPFLCNRRKASCPVPKGKSRCIEAETVIVVK